MFRCVVPALIAFSLGLCAWLVVRSGESIVSSSLVVPDAPARKEPATTLARYEQDPRSLRRQVVAVPDHSASTPARRSPRADNSGVDIVRVHGRVRSRGRTLADCSLAFHSMGAGLDGNEADWDFTDAEGHFEVFLPRGRYVVLDDDRGSWLTNVALPRTGHEHVLDIDLPTALLSGRVVNTHNQSVAGATVYALRSHGAQHDVMTQGLMARAGRARSDAHGAFELRDLHAGAYRIVARSGGTLSRALKLELGADPHGELRLVIAAGSTLEVSVKGPDGRPAAVRLFVSPGSSLSSLAQLRFFNKLGTDSDGMFAIEGLLPGPYTIFVAGGHAPEVALGTTIEFRTGQPIELVAQACGRLSTVVTRADGTPVAGAYLDVRGLGGGLVLASLEWFERGPASDAQGRIELDDVLPGDYSIAAGVEGRLGQRARVSVRSNRTSALRLQVTAE